MSILPHLRHVRQRGDVFLVGIRQWYDCKGRLTVIMEKLPEITLAVELFEQGIKNRELLPPREGRQRTRLSRNKPVRRESGACAIKEQK